MIKWNFTPKKMQDFYPADQDVTPTYNIPLIVKGIKQWIWKRAYYSDYTNSKSGLHLVGKFLSLHGSTTETYGELLKRIGQELSADPYALAAYSIFESYKEQGPLSSFNPHQLDTPAAGMTATQAQYTKGTQVPGTKHKLPSNLDAAILELRSSPDYAVRYLADEFKTRYNEYKDLALAFPHVAYPKWTNPKVSHGHYGTQAQYVSRAYVLYNAFLEADELKK